MDTKEMTKNIFTFRDEKPAPFQCEYTSSIRDSHIPLIIDNGKHLQRSPQLLFSVPHFQFPRFGSVPRYPRYDENK